MPNPSEETLALLVRRMRAGLWILLLAIALFGLKLFALAAGAGGVLLALKAVQLGTVLAMFWLLRDPRRRRWVVPAALVTLGEVSFTTAASGIVEGDVATTLLLFTIMVVATAAFLPWGARPQIATVGLTTAAALWNVVGVGVPAGAVASPAVALALAGVTSIYMAWDTERHQRERQRAATAVAAAHARSEAEARIFAALARVGQEMIAVVETPVILDRLCRLTSEVLGCDRSHTWLWQPEEDAFVPVAGFGELPGYGPAMGVAKVPRVQIRRLLARLEREDVVQQGGEGELPSAYTIPTSIHGALRWGTQVIGIHTAGRYTRTEPFSAEEQRIMRGITQIASLALSNARLVEQLEQASRLKSEFVSTVSHELRTPLHVILGYADMIADPTVEAALREKCTARLANAGRDLLELIESTLDIGRMETGHDEVRFEAVALASFWSSLGHACADIPRAKGVDLDWSDGVPDVQLMTDPRKLTAIVRNLVANALKFTERGWVRADLELGAETLALRVADSGVGIRADDQTLIFEMFRQVDGSDSRRHGGSGLGLYIVRRFAEQLGGTVAVESAPGRGSLFTVTLPRRRTADEAAA
jgi:signal transduction histidine kinase